MKRAFVRSQEGKDWWECCIRVECWLAVLWKVGGGAGQYLCFRLMIWHGVVGLAESEPSRYRKSSRGRVGLLIGGCYQKLIG